MQKKLIVCPISNHEPVQLREFSRMEVEKRREE